MRGKNQRREESQFSILSPWEVDSEDTYCTRLFHDPPITTPNNNARLDNNLPTINSKKRAVSNCNRIRNENQPPPSHQKPLKYSKLNYEGENRAFTTLAQTRTERAQKKREGVMQERGVLQEVSVKNFIIEGEQKGREKESRKKESSYIMKQKFNEFRRSMKSIQHFKQNCNLRITRYD